MTDQSLELHTAAIYTLNLTYTSDLEIHEYACTCGTVPLQVCLQSRAVDGMNMNMYIYILMLKENLH